MWIALVLVQHLILSRTPSPSLTRNTRWRGALVVYLPLVALPSKHPHLPPSLEVRDGGALLFPTNPIPLPHSKRETRGFFSFQTPPSPSLTRKVRWRGLSSLPTPCLAWNARRRGPSLPSHWISKLCPSGHGFDVRRLSTETTPRQACHPPDLWQGTGLGRVPPTQPVPVPPKPIPGFPHGFLNPCYALQHLWFPGAYITRIECAVNMLIVFHSLCFP